MDISMEIRKLPFSSILELSRILEPGESWKTLMGLIPKQLYCDNYHCDLEVNNLRKYRTDHFRLIEDSSIKYKKSCTEILLDEWGTSGQVLPALGHLKYLLEKAELFRAADYVTVTLLKQPPPQRPQKGPAARVNLTSELTRNTMNDNIEEILDKMQYPSTIIENITSINTNINYSTNQKPNLIPKIVISESPDTEEPKSVFNMPLPLVIQEKNSTRSEPSIVSDMMKFSTNSVQESESQENAYILPNLSFLNNRSELMTEAQNHNIPDIVLNFGDSNSQMSNEASESLQQSSSNALESSNANIPNIHLLHKSEKNLESAIMQNEDQMIPAFSELLNNSHNSSTSSNISAFTPDNNLSDETNNSQRTAKTSRSCASPLPNLSLNTLLPHFSYLELEVATNNFDETPQTQSGRFLGSGAFGKVYLALGLLGKPVAVKKLLLDNVDVVHINDTVTKQFRNEVEVLSKYKHENLLSLVGYSCDGCTYCLMYEYMPGGALKDRLHNPENKLIWTERLYIAIGTAKAISYLHTAFSTPLIHRDVKTANILLDSNNKPKLCDFGLIKLTPNQNTYINTTAFGTSAYMAPEAFRGDISVKLDTFSFGVVLLELLTALPPYDDNRPGRDLVTHLQEVCDDDIQPFLDNSAGSWTSNNVNFAEDLFNLANRCLINKKAKRPNMVEVTTDLTNLLQKAL